MKTFNLVRDKDISGVSGIGIVAEGTVFTNGKVALAWLSGFHTVEILDDIKEVLDIHGHEGSTQIQWDFPVVQMVNVKEVKND